MFDALTIRNLFTEPLEKTDPLAALQQAILSNHEAILDINRAQLDAGEDAEGNDLGNYSPWYSRIKGRSAPIDLKKTGDYRDGMYLVITGDTTDIRSHDDKEAELDLYVYKRTEGEPLGIQDDNIPEMADVIKPDFVQNFANALESNDTAY